MKKLFSYYKYSWVLFFWLVSCASLKTLQEHQISIDYQIFGEQQKRLTLPDGHTLSYTDRGSGPVILMVHGLPTSSWMYRHISVKLAEAGFRTIAPDMLGYGNSDKPEGFDIYNRQHQAKRLLQFMQQLGIDQWTQMFHDAGGLWSWELLSLEPEKVNAIVVLNTLIYREGFHPPMRLKTGGLARSMANLYCNPTLQVLTMRQTLSNGLSVHAITYDTARGYYKPLARANCDAIYHFIAHTKSPNFDFEKTIQGLKKPAMVIWGEDDDILRWKEQVPRLQQDMQIPDKDIHILSGKKHFIAEEAPDTITQLVTEFLQRDDR